MVCTYNKQKLKFSVQRCTGLSSCLNDFVDGLALKLTLSIFTPVHTAKWDNYF